MLIIAIKVRLKILPEHLRIGTNAPNEGVLLARSDNKKNWSARAIRKKVMLRDYWKYERAMTYLQSASYPTS